MAGQSQFGAVKEEFRGGGVYTELLTSLKSAVQNAEQAASREGKFKRENQLLQEKLQIEVLERFRLEKEAKESKELASRLREELDGVYKRLKENEVDQKKFIELKRKSCEVECEKLRAQTDLDVYRTRFKELEGRVCCLEKDLEMLSRLEKNDQVVDMEIEKDASGNLTTAEINSGERKAGENFVKSEVLSGSNAYPNDGSSYKRTEHRVVIIVSDDEAYLSDE